MMVIHNTYPMRLFLNALSMSTYVNFLKTYHSHSMVDGGFPETS